MTRSLSDSVCVPWATTADLCSPCLENLADYDAGLVDDALYAASEILFHLTRQRWPGACEDTVRPTSRYRSADTRITNRRYGWLSSSLGLSGVGGRCLGGYPLEAHQPGCHWLSQIELGELPIVAVTQVKIDGAVVNAARYRVDDFRWLVWISDPADPTGRRGWPCCSNHELPTSDVDTFEVSYTVGSGPSRGGARAAGVLACQLILAWTPAGVGQCKLPKRVTSMTRQQVTMNLSDPVALFEKGLTGVPEVDLWVQAVNRPITHRHGVVVVPERRRTSARRTTS